MNNDAFDFSGQASCGGIFPELHNSFNTLPDTSAINATPSDRTLSIETSRLLQQQSDANGPNSDSAVSSLSSSSSYSSSSSSLAVPAPISLSSMAAAAAAALVGSGYPLPYPSPPIYSEMKNYFFPGTSNADGGGGSGVFNAAGANSLVGFTLPNTDGSDSCSSGRHQDQQQRQHQDATAQYFIRGLGGGSGSLTGGTNNSSPIYQNNLNSFFGNGGGIQQQLQYQNSAPMYVNPAFYRQTFSCSTSSLPPITTTATSNATTATPFFRGDHSLSLPMFSHDGMDSFS